MTCQPGRLLQECLRAFCVWLNRRRILLASRVARRSKKRPMDGGGLAEATLVVARATSDFQWPQFDSEAWFQFILLVIMLILCALASATETALTSVSRIKLRNLAEEGDQKAAEIQNLLANPNVFLSTILIV